MNIHKFIAKMFKYNSKELVFETKESQCHLKNVCLWNQKDFLKVLKNQKNVFLLILLLILIYFSYHLCFLYMIIN